MNIETLRRSYAYLQVRLTLFQDGKRCVPAEIECEDNHQLTLPFSESAATAAAGAAAGPVLAAAAAGSQVEEGVRCNNGVVGADKLGRASMLRIRTFFTARDKLRPDGCARLLQCNARCMLARRRVAARRAARGASRNDSAAADIRTDLQAEGVWVSYCVDCAARSCHPIRPLRSQLGTQRLVVRRYAITDAGLVALGGLLQAAAQVDRLRSLTLMEVGLRSVGAITLARALAGASHLTALVLDCNPLSCQRGGGGSGDGDAEKATVTASASAGVEAIARFAEASQSLRLLSLEETRLGAGDIVRLAAAAGRSASLRALSLSGNPQDLRARALAPVTAIVSALQRRGSEGGSLLSLEYGGNPLGADAAVRLAEGLLSAGRLRRICLSRTGACRAEAACKALGRWLGDAGCAVDRLDLSWCGMAEAGAVALAEAVNQCASLRLLQLDGNPFGRNGG